MKIEAMAGYPGSYKVTGLQGGSDLSQMRNQFAALTEKIQELTFTKLTRTQVWCTGCHTEGHLAAECHRLRGAGPVSTPVGPSPVRPSGGVAQVAVADPFHGPTQYHAFPNNHKIKAA